jgi:leucyl-tRNA synthetase
MTERIYDPAQIEPKWQKWWEEHGTNQIDVHNAKNPFYVLMMFPYPSAEGLHVGNVFAFTGADIQGRFQRLKGHDVFEPIGFDAFGMHSEMFAQRIGKHPADIVPNSIRNFTKQLKMMAFMFDWRHQVDTTSPEYYKWTQWVFLQLYKAGYVYRDVKEVNYAPSIGSVISDEQVMPDGTFERDGTPVERRKLPSWFFKITDFADRLVDNLEWLDWSDTTKTAQRNWIGRSTGGEVDFEVAGHGERITVFTTRPDTLFGATFMVLSPEHPMVEAITTGEQKPIVEEYQSTAAQQAEVVVDKAKTGVFTGAYAINPANGHKLPVYIADYVLMGYGTGAIMAVPSGDHRDFEFATKFGLDVPCIIDPDMDAFQPDMVSGIDANASPAEIRAAVLAGKAAWSGPGRMINSSNAELSLDGLPKEEAIETMVAWLEKKGIGRRKHQFRLRDWGISRQRYWGPPVPIIYDEDGNAHPVPEDQLPVLLPPMQDLSSPGDGRGPLAKAEDWVNVEINGKKYRRETDVMDNFLDSAWYFLRYPSARDDKQAWDPELIKKWLPVDIYIGGNEHAVLHLLYTRFLCHALTAAGVLDMSAKSKMKDPAEPFAKFRAHGLLIKDGAKMSKSKGNIINPDEFVAAHGTDTLRTYLMFLGPYTHGGDFRDKDIQGVRRFFNRVFSYYFEENRRNGDESALPNELRVKLHQTIRKVGDDIVNLSYNTAIAALMELLNAMKAAEASSASLREAFCIMLAPFAPHLAEEIWQEGLGKKGTVFSARWPEFDPALTVLDQIEIVVQVNGKVRDRVTVAREASNDELEAAALATDGVKKQLEGGAAVRKVIVVPGRLVNVIVG